MTPEEARELRHELRTPVNHLIGYAELLLEEDDVSEADIEALEAVRARARDVLELVPGLLGDGDGGDSGADASAQADSTASIAALIERVAAIESLTAGRGRGLPPQAVRPGAAESAGRGVRGEEASA